MAKFQIEFPDFPAADMPTIPAGWKDISWRNDTCPSFDAFGFRVFVDYADDSVRELPGGRRFFVMDEDDGTGEQVSRLESDDWAEVLAFIAARSAQ